MQRYYVGVDWADEFHQVWVSNTEGKKVAEMKVEQSPAGMGEFGRWLHERKAQGTQLWAAIEKPQGELWTFCWTTELRSIRLTPKLWTESGTAFA